jgi:DNA modification methylase
MTEGSKDRRAFNSLTPREWTKLSRSVWTSAEVSSTREKHHLEHGATFSTALAERVIKMYTTSGDLVLDPFLGVGTTLVAARRLDRRGIGIELYEKYAAIAEAVLAKEAANTALERSVICGDSRNVLDWVEPESVQLVFTSPPYADFIHRSVTDRRKTHKKSRLVLDNKSVVKPYGSSSQDFGNLEYAEFLTQIKSLMADLLIVTAPGGYNVWVVKDCRNTENGVPLVDVHSDIARLGRDVGFLYHDLIIWDQNDQRSLVLLGYPSVFYVNVNHTFLVVLRKPPKGKGK